ncbi:MAG: 2-oxo acid dehydrogenase subunit E2, partial [Planctomycetes bacterium]|nr:2-oxo acid dehydrogenase subunit E2 [Planctomycetota bacterium]
PITAPAGRTRPAMLWRAQGDARDRLDALPFVSVAGMLGVVLVAILGISRTQEQVKMIDGQPCERLMLPLSLSYDHRVINGADAARFVVRLSTELSSCFQLMIRT